MNFQIAKYQNLITNLLLNGNFMENTGLMHGKTGLAILFYHLTKITGNKVFEHFGGELIDDISRNLSTRSPVDFENGLAGIGWGLEYLVQNRFLEADADEVLEEFDKEIFRKFLENTPANIDLLNGVLGTAHYFLMRIRGAKQKQKNMITETNRLALQQICNHLNPVLSQTVDFLKEPYNHNSANLNQKKNCDGEPVPVFEIIWNLPIFIGFLAEIFELNIMQSAPTKLLKSILTPLNSVSNLPVLQCNRLLLLLSLIKLKNKVQMTLASGTNETNLLTNKIIRKIVIGFDNEKYQKELNRLGISIRNGIPGIALIHKKLYEQTNDLKYKNEYKTLLNKLIPDKFINQFRYDYSSPVKTNEQELGILKGISGLLLTSLIK
jgi:lantibiotic modifying enzyme